jgi:DNA-binding HxlR family transcriptional regulator
MRSYNQYCPIAKGAEIVGDRWNLLIVREMLAGVERFNELQRLLPGISRSVLTQRLSQLERCGVVTRRALVRGYAYELTPSGRGLGVVVLSVGEWAALWAFPEPTKLETDPLLVMVWLSRHLNLASLPSRRVVIRFDLSGDKRLTCWLVLDPGAPSLCLQHPGFEEDILVESSAATMYEVYFGRLGMTDAIRAGTVVLHGTSFETRDFPNWFGASAFAPTINERSRLSTN